MRRYERANIARMKGYTSGEQPDDGRTIKLNTNENPYPPSPAVSAALASLDASSLRTYPQPTADPLRDAIASHHGITRDQVVITNGGDEALRLALTTFVEPGAPMGMAEPSYSLYPVLAEIHDAPVHRIELDDEWQLPDDAAQRLNDAGAMLTCVVNPHAPSGGLYTAGELGALAAALDGLLLIDEAYVDFIDPSAGYDAAPLLRRHDNVLLLRTFSKGYSLAGLRLGYLLGPETLITPIVTKTRDSYNIDGVSQALGLAAFGDRPYAEETWAKVRDERRRLAEAFTALGMTSPPSQSNFLLVSVGAGRDAEAIYLALKDAGILVRYFSAPRLDDKLRITVGTPEENDRLLGALKDILEG